MGEKSRSNQREGGIRVVTDSVSFNLCFLLA